jgi:hypothetical protein
MTKKFEANAKSDSWGHTTGADFFEYYARESQTAATAQRFWGVDIFMLRVAARSGIRAAWSISLARLLLASGLRAVAYTGCLWLVGGFLDDGFREILSWVLKPYRRAAP